MKRLSREISTEENQDEAEKAGSRHVVQVACCILANISIIASGMGLGYPAITTQLLREEMSETRVSWFASVTAIACPFGGPLSGYLVERFGRKGTLIVIDVLSMVSWLIIGFSSRSNQELHFIQLMIARTLIGVLIGMSTTPGVMYTSEMCDPQLRGRLTMLSSPFFTAFGMLLIYLLGYLIPV
jgi:MFS family permease